MVIFLLLGSVVIEVASSNLYQAVLTAGNMWRHVMIVSAWSIVLVFVSDLTIPRHGAAGLALAYLMAWCFSAAAYGGIAVAASGPRTDKLRVRYAS